jgi:hypothetical protein
VKTARIADRPVETRTAHLPDTTVQHFLEINLFGLTHVYVTYFTQSEFMNQPLTDCQIAAGPRQHTLLDSQSHRIHDLILLSGGSGKL